MSTYQAKTKETSTSVTAFVKSVPDKQKQEDSFALIEMMKRHSGLEPKMWGPAIIGFGSCHYKYESGHEGDMPMIAFSPRKASMVLYIDNFEKKESLLKELGKHKTSVACLYFKRLADINVDVLNKMIPLSIKATKAKYK